MGNGPVGESLSLRSEGLSLCRRVSERLGAGTGKHKLIVNIGSLLSGAAEEEEEGFDLLTGEGVAAGLVVEAGEGVLEAVAAAELVGELRHGAVDVLGLGVVEEGEGALGDAVASGGAVQVVDETDVLGMETVAVLGCRAVAGGEDGEMVGAGPDVLALPLTEGHAATGGAS